MAIDAKCLSEHRDLGRQVVFLDDPIRPHAAHEFVFAEHRATSVDEGHERIKRPTAQLDRLAIGQQLSAMADDPEPAKFNGYGIFRQPCHGVDCSATLPDFPTLIAHRSEASRAFAATRSVVPNPSVKRR